MTAAAAAAAVYLLIPPMLSVTAGGLHRWSVAGSSAELHSHAFADGEGRRSLALLRAALAAGGRHSDYSIQHTRACVSDGPHSRAGIKEIVEGCASLFSHPATRRR